MIFLFNNIANAESILLFVTKIYMIFDDSF